MRPGPEYDRAVERATREQGLVPLANALRREGVRFDIEQTGGFVMALVVPIDQGNVVASKDVGWVVYFYPGPAWHEGGEGEEKLWDATLRQTVSYLKQAQLGRERRRGAYRRTLHHASPLLREHSRRARRRGVR
jgi:hypothetical protein